MRGRSTQKLGDELAPQFGVRRHHGEWRHGENQQRNSPTIDRMDAAPAKKIVYGACQVET